MLNRRHLIQAIGGGAAMTALGNLRLAHAATPNDSRLVVIIMRGAMDGLHALAPYRDSHYRNLRRSIAVPPPGVSTGAIDLDGQFGLNPSLRPVADLYRKKELLLIPAASTRYRDRSHFDGQNVLENGTAKPFGADDGWLNRALQEIAGNRRLGLSIGPTIPLIMQGNAGVSNWSDSSLPEVSEEFLSSLSMIYKDDDEFFLALTEAMTSGTVSADLTDTDAKSKDAANLIAASRAAADLLGQPGGPRVAVLESHGWDTHYSQIFRMDALLDGLAKSIMTFHDMLGSEWRNTTVIAVSEFGRTAGQNGSHGTDHGTGGLAILAGGAINGGRIGGDWPGLAPNQLYQGRDVRPTTDYESIFKGVLRDQFGIDRADLDRNVFPDSTASRPLDGLIR